MQKKYCRYLNWLLKFLIKIVLFEALIANHVFALLPPPPPPPTLEQKLQWADIVAVGVLDRYVFIGYDSSNKEEFLVDFDSITGENRRRQAVIKVKKILYSEDDYSKLREIRVDYLTHEIDYMVKDDYKNKWMDGGGFIFILKKFNIQFDSNKKRFPVFCNITSPLPRKENEKKIRQIINSNRQKSTE